MATMGDLGRQGFDGIEITCSCRRVVRWPFPLLQRNGIWADQSVETVATRFRCTACDARVADPGQIRPWRVGDGAPKMTIHPLAWKST